MPSFFLAVRLGSCSASLLSQHSGLVGSPCTVCATQELRSTKENKLGPLSAWSHQLCLCLEAACPVSSERPKFPMGQEQLSLPSICSLAEKYLSPVSSPMLKSLLMPFILPTSPEHFFPKTFHETLLFYMYLIWKKKTVWKQIQRWIICPLIE